MTMNRTISFTTLVFGFLILAATGSAQSDPDGFFQNQVSNYIRALNDPNTGTRVRKIWFQLVGYSNRMYPVLPSQRFNAGTSLPNGVVLLDLSIAGDDDEEVTAFFLAHEWGHQVWGHPYMALTQYGQYIIAVSGTAAEDAADKYSARFLKAKHYDLDPVINFLCSLPEAPAGDTHSTGAQRAKIVSSAYGAPNASPCSSSAADHDTGAAARQSPKGHWEIVACTHPLHPAGDEYPCTHVCASQWGPRPCHAFDRYPCSHPAHPSGDRVWVPAD
jgi:hypothetical protein